MKAQKFRIFLKQGTYHILSSLRIDYDQLSVTIVQTGNNVKQNLTTFDSADLEDYKEQTQ